MMIKYTTRWHCSSTNVAPFIVLSRSKKNKQWRFSFLNWKISNYLYFYQEKKLKNPTIIVHIENFVHVESTEWRVHLSRVYFHSLRCLKSAFSWLNKSVIPSADREASRSTSASAVNLQVHKNMAHAHTRRSHSHEFIWIFPSLSALVWLLLGDDQLDFPRTHLFGPALHGGCADVWDELRQSCIFIEGQHYQHADGVPVIRKRNDVIFQPLRCGGSTLVKVEKRHIVTERNTT